MITFPPKPVALSWRDPDGFVIKVDGRILRAVSAEKAEQTRVLLREPWVVKRIAEGQLPATIEVPRPAQLEEYGDRYIWLAHAELAMPCYPHEITALQLYDSGALTLSIAIDAAEHGWVLKDASAWNVLHSRGKAVFIDFLSFDRQASSSTWMAYGQFVRHFLLPLLLYRKLGITPPEVFIANRDGMTPERVYQLVGPSRLMSAMAMELVLLPKWLTRAGSQLIAERKTQPARSVDKALARDLVLHTLRRLERVLKRLLPEQSGRESLWENYEEGRAHYSDVDLAAKKDFVREQLDSSSTVLDLGCNAGEFSLLAAEGGRDVVAADFDHSALSRFYARIRGQSKGVAPLMLNIARPTPAVGWENVETPSFLERAHGRFDCVLALGLVHHLIVSDRATLDLVAQLFDRLGPKSVIVEWIDPKDQKFAQLAGFNASLYSALDEAAFEKSMGLKFSLVAKMPLPCATRVMYLWRRKLA